MTTQMGNASIPDSSGVIHGCYSTSKGSLYIIDSSTQSCSAHEAGLNWDQSGNSGLPFTCPGCNLTQEGSNFAGKDLTGAYLVGANLAGDLDLTSVNLTNANLSYADINVINLTDATLTGANFENATNGSNTNFLNTNLTNVDFTNADLSGALNMSTATVTGVTWSNTKCPDGSNSDSNGNTCVGHF